MVESPNTGSYNLVPVPGGGSLILSSHPASLPGLRLEQAIALYIEQDTRLLLSLTTLQELSALKLETLESICQDQGIEWVHAPIEDLKTPDQHFETQWLAKHALMHNILNDGHVVSLHCWSGLGRSGTIAARLLVERGLSPKQAMIHVREHRPGAIETPEQMQYVMSLPKLN